MCICSGVASSERALYQNFLGCPFSENKQKYSHKQNIFENNKNNTY